MVNAGYFTDPPVDSSNIIATYTELNSITPVNFVAYVPVFDGSFSYERAALYQIISGSLPKNLILTPTGYLSGSLAEMDTYVLEYTNLQKSINHVNYGKIGSASLFNKGIGLSKKVYFVVRASTSYGYVDKEFGFAIKNNWSSDRDELVRKINGNSSST